MDICGVSVGVALIGAGTAGRVFGHAATSGAARTNVVETVG